MKGKLSLNKMVRVTTQNLDYSNRNLGLKLKGLYVVACYIRQYDHVDQ